VGNRVNIFWGLSTGSEGKYPGGGGVLHPCCRPGALHRVPLLALGGDVHGFAMECCVHTGVYTKCTFCTQQQHVTRLSISSSVLFTLTETTSSHSRAVQAPYCKLL